MQKKYAFTIIEVMIIVTIIGIIAAIVLPSFTGHITVAKEVSVKDNLRMMRSAIELYAAQHNCVAPGYPLDNQAASPLHATFVTQMVNSSQYLSRMPENPFNNKSTLKMVGNNEDFPAAPVETDSFGWIYKPATKTIKLNWPGNDSTGLPYFNY